MVRPLGRHLLIFAAFCTLSNVIGPGRAGSQDFFPPGYDVPLSAPYGEVTIGRPRGSAFRPVVIYFPDAAWSNEAVCDVREAFAELDAAGIAVAELWMSGDTLDRDIRSIERGLRTIRQRAGSYRLDLSRVALLGCGAGGHFAALVGTNPELMARAGLNLSSVAGAAIVEGIGFDLRAVVAGDGREMPREIHRYFSRLMGNLDVYSPQAHLAAPNSPSLFLSEGVGMDQAPTAAMDFARGLQAAGSELVIERLPPKVGEREHANAGQSSEANGSSLANYLIARLNHTSQGR